MTAMKKRLVSLLCTLALCLGLLPTAALAAGEGAPAKLYVGDQQVIVAETVTYWATDDSGGLIRLNDATDNSNNWNVKYDPYTATLTLNEAKISGSYDQYNNPFTAGIYAKGSSNQSVALTIELIGTNTITGNYGIYVDAQQGETVVGTNASLFIRNSSDNGRLEVSGSSHGIYIKSGTGNASLTINDASVVASSSSTFDGYAGVCVQSSSDATSSPQLSLAVNGGSLTTSASEGNDGIQFYVGAYGATSATTSLSVTNNAIVDARTGGISASGVNVTPELNIGSTGSTGGIVWNGAEGTVYGDVTLDEPLTVGESETLTIPEGSTLNGNSNLTNNGTVTIENGGTLTSGDAINNTGTINVENGGNLGGTPTGGTVVKAPAITTESPLPEGTVGTEYNQPLAAENNPTSWSVTSGTLPAGLTLNSDGTITGIPTAAGSSTFTVTAENSAGSASKEYTLNIQAATISVTGVTLDQTELALYTGESKTLTATVEPADATNQDVTWSSSDDAIATVKDGTVTAVKAGEATITVTTADGGKQATCKVKVTQATYNISVEGSLNFDAAYTGYAQPAAQTVTVANTGNQSLTLTQPASTNSFEVGTLSKTQLAPDETATFTVQPKAGLAVGSYEETINISGSNGNNQVSTNVTASFAVVDIHDDKVDNKLTVTSGISAGISGTAFTTAEKVQAELTRVLVQDSAFTAGNTAFYDVKLQYSLDGGTTWFEATEATFPAEGITVTLPYPSGTGKDTHNFRVVHMFTVTSARLGTEAGKTETPAVTKTDSGLQVTLKGLSPVVIGWDKIETRPSATPAPSATATPAPATTPAPVHTPTPADNTTYYTCPSCGRHNWTATEAGYRCDNCGYLESTKQLSGYGNVKGTYTPKTTGSNSAKTTASLLPQTGDESNLALWGGLIVICALALGGILVYKRRR